MTPHYTRNPSMQAVEMDGELVMMGQEQGEYYGLRDVAASVWRHLEQPRTLDDLAALIAEEYDVATAQCRPDVAVFLADLVGKDLAEVTQLDEPDKRDPGHVESLSRP